MTTNELRRWFNDVYGLQPWPETFNVTAETYGNVCYEIFQHWMTGRDTIAPIKLGPHGGIMFKGVELIVENYDNPLQHELLDLITLMPDSQTQELIDYIMDLRRIRSERDNQG